MNEVRRPAARLEGRTWGRRSALGLLLTAAGCEVWDFAQNPSISLRLPSRTFTISSSDARWKPPPEAFFTTRLDCTAPADCCQAPPGAPVGTPALDCQQLQIGCDAGQCTSSLALELPSLVELSKVPALMGMNAKVVSRMTLLSLEYTVTNQLGVTLPPVRIYVAPAQVTSAMGSSDAKLLDTLPMSLPGGPVTTSNALTPAAQKDFEGFARDVNTPFNLIASTALSFRSGSPAPQGKVDVTVTGTVLVRF